MDHEENIHAVKAKAVLQQMLEHYQGIVDEISDSDFQPLFDILEADDIKIEKGDFTKRCNKKLYESISTEFKDSWEFIGIGDCIAYLEQAKSKCSETDSRPAKKAPEEIVRHQHQDQLRKKKAFYTKQIEFQEAKLQGLIVDVVEMRDELSAVHSKRIDLTKKIIEDELKIKELDNYLDQVGEDL